MIDIVERLRAAPRQPDCPHGLRPKACKDCEIAELEAEKQALREALSKTYAHLLLAWGDKCYDGPGILSKPSTEKALKVARSVLCATRGNPPGKPESSS